MGQLQRRYPPTGHEGSQQEPTGVQVSFACCRCRREKVIGPEKGLCESVVCRESRRESEVAGESKVNKSGRSNTTLPR